MKSLYAKFIDWDEEMYDHDTSTPSHATKYERTFHEFVDMNLHIFLIFDIKMCLLLTVALQ